MTRRRPMLLVTIAATLVSATLLTACAARASGPSAYDWPACDQAGVIDLGDSAWCDGLLHVMPRLKAQRTASLIMERVYPDRLRAAGIGGTTKVMMRIEPDGTVADAWVVRSSGLSDLDDAAIQAVHRFEFDPALRPVQAGSQTWCRADVYVALDVTFEAR